VEPITHGLLGAALGQALYGRSLGRRALGFGAFAEMLPDVDVVMNFTGPLSEFVYHRGITHALWFGPVVGPALGWLAWRRRGKPPGTLGAWIGLFVVGLLTHPLLDACTTYGTQLLTPFSDRRFAFDAVAIVDPAYTLILVGAIAIGLIRGVASNASRNAALVALALSTAYLVYGYALNERLEGQVRQALRAEGAPGAAEVEAYPTLLQLYLRRVVVRLGVEVRIGWVSTWRRGDRGRWEVFTTPSDPRIDAARATPEGRLLEWFAAGQTVGRIVDDGAAVEIDDLRYGFPGHPKDGLWGIRIPFDREGRPRDGVTRFNRPLPQAPGALLRRIFREAFLN
jgi:inner membrane protein